MTELATFLQVTRQYVQRQARDWKWVRVSTGLYEADRVERWLEYYSLQKKATDLKKTIPFDGPSGPIDE